MNNEMSSFAEELFKSNRYNMKMNYPSEVWAGSDLVERQVYQDCFGKPIVEKWFYQVVYDWSSYEIEWVEPLEEGFYLEVQIEGFYREDDIPEERFKHIHSNTCSFAWDDDYINFWTYGTRYKDARDMIQTVIKQLEPFTKTTITEDKYLISERIFVDEMRNVYFMCYYTDFLENFK